jgi:hypothetical protein
MEVRETIAGFDLFLFERGLSLEAVIIGGAALNLLGVVSRRTKDCDVLDPELPGPVVQAARDYARDVREKGGVLRDDWLNNGPRSLLKALPSGWEARLQLAFEGKALVLMSLGRDDLLRSKLFALCDRGIDLDDCIALRPTPGELKAFAAWVEAQDLNPDWPTHVRRTLADLARRLGHGL